MSKKIVWEKWLDPFAETKEKEKEEEDSDIKYMDSYEKAEKAKFSGNILVGPMGVIPINEGSSPSKVYKFWMMHSNFNISEPVEKIINEFPGVESLDIFTRYRARIGIGKAFDDEKVKRRIEKALCRNKNENPTKTITTSLDVLKRQMSEKYKFWAITTTTTNEYKLFGGDTQEFVQTKVSENEYVKVHKSWE